MPLKQTIARWRDRFNWRMMLREYLQMTIGALFLILSFDIFQAPAKMAPGGVSGLSVIINSMTGAPPGLIMLILNIPMLYLGFRSLGRFRFLVRTVYVVLLFNLGVDILERWLPHGVTDDLLLNALYGGILGGIGSGFIYRARSTVAGTGVLSRTVQLRTGIPISQVYVLIDGGVIALLGLTFGWENALYALIMLFIWGMAADYILEGPSVVRTVFIVTDAASATSQAITSRLGVGVTSWVGRGMYTGRAHEILFCTVNRSDVNTVQAVVVEIDPDAFIVIGQGHRASGGMLRSQQLA
jgi:uncharacterized membrane-anchored protein YitT (DUF2179 family)